jgi:hypothetical protein
MNRDHINDEHSDEQADENEWDENECGTTPELEGISPLNPLTFPRAEDDEETFAHSPEFHDIPDPGPNVGRGKTRHRY